MVDVKGFGEGGIRGGINGWLWSVEMRGSLANYLVVCNLCGWMDGWISTGYATAMPQLFIIGRGIHK